ncbi:MAG TPA: bifunctional 4-hydroxy-3-methylbut-2-enyl diphosphate reductase/30S ribosomal protein S1, partial [Proteobacteria bacterium]|nr:bifunctional 4-hydroxy-3-methylbut-2-enyl diphosphate reductase/30S ribosomal protein S1 [Pseudomonadota bacterium]
MSPSKVRRPQIVVGEKAGFCMGVRRAMELVLEAVRHAEDIKVYGPLVHNPQVIELLRLRGVECERDKDKIRDGTVVLRSHGVPFEVEQEFRARGLNILDATCPKVKRVQRLARKHAQDGRTVLIFGDPDHAEVKAILSYAKGRAKVVQKPEELETLSIDGTPALLAQTTQDRKRFGELAELLKRRYPG